MLNLPGPRSLVGEGAGWRAVDDREAIIEAARKLAARQLEQEAQGEAVEVSATPSIGGLLAFSVLSLPSSTGARLADAGPIPQRGHASKPIRGRVKRIQLTGNPG